MTSGARAFTLVALGSLGAPACDAGQVDLERMLDQHKLEPFEATQLFEDGRAMQRPPPGSVPRAHLSQPSELTSATDARGYRTRIPLPLDRAVLERGAERFRIFCAVCHGELGDGRSRVAENMKLRPPPSLHEPRIRAYPPGRLFRVVTEGYGLMPAYAAALEPRERWAVVAYVQALELSQSIALAELPESMRAEAKPWLE